LFEPIVIRPYKELEERDDYEHADWHNPIEVDTKAESH